jgi:hypothetical protein
MPNAIDKLLNDILMLPKQEDLNRVYDAACKREKELRAQHTQEVVASLRIGDRVRLQGVSPQYLNGLEGTVASLPQDGSVPVKLDHPQLARRYASPDGILRARAETLTVIPAGEKPRTTITSSGAVVTHIPIDEGTPRRRRG